VEQVGRTGLPNYFDDQRFGSVAAGQFVARHMILGQYEDALKLALAAPYEHDRSAQKKEKAILREHWGDWKLCKERLPRSHARSLVDYLLHHPGDFRGALERLSPDLRGLYLSAYQSYLWNNALTRWIEAQFPTEDLLQLPWRLGRVAVPVRLDSARATLVAGLRIPLPSPRVVFVDGDAVSAALHEVMREEDITPDQLRLRGFKKLFFSRGERAAWYFPTEIGYTTAGDDLEPSRQKLQLAFELPRGCYATLLLKRLSAE
jgi:tRNA pseudouridine13 synthase